MADRPVDRASMDRPDRVSMDNVPGSNTPLTRKNLARLNALNGTEDDSKHSAYLFDDTDTDDTMKATSTTDSGFEKRAYENGFWEVPSTQDVSTARTRFAQHRTSPQPSEQAHQRYRDDISESYNEATASHLVRSDIMRDYRHDRNYGRYYSRAITEIPTQDFNYGLSNAEPDVLEGLKTRVLPEHLHDNALHKKDSLSFCHFAAEFKRTDGNLHRARLQAAYDGAILVNARERALERARANPSADIAALDKAANEVAVFTCVTDGQVAEVYAHYYDGEYHQDMVGCESLLDSNRGRELIRNTQDYTRGKSYELANLLGADLEEEEEEEENVVVKAKKAVAGWFW